MWKDDGEGSRVLWEMAKQAEGSFFMRFSLLGVDSDGRGDRNQLRAR